MLERLTTNAAFPELELDDILPSSVKRCAGAAKLARRHRGRRTKFSQRIVFCNVNVQDDAGSRAIFDRFHETLRRSSWPTRRARRVPVHQ